MMIQLRGVWKQFGSFTAVEDLSLEVAPGELFGFLGPNGAGKTTTLKMIMGLLQPTRGEITVGGYNVMENPEAVKSLAGFIPDTPYVYPQLTMEEYLDFVEDLYDCPPDETRPLRERYYEQFRLGDWHQDLIRNLSHGMKQKMLFTGLFMRQPRVMVIDEPMVGLDPQSARTLKELLRQEVEQRDVAVFLSTHSLEVAEEICDRVGILSEGRLLDRGRFQDLRRRQEQSLEDVFLRMTSERSSAARAARA